MMEGRFDAVKSNTAKEPVLLGPGMLGHLTLSCLFAFSYSSWPSQGKNTDAVCIQFSSGPNFVRTLHHDPSIWVALHGMAHSFIELDKAVVHMIRLVSFL